MCGACMCWVGRVMQRVNTVGSGPLQLCMNAKRSIRALDLCTLPTWLVELLQRLIEHGCHSPSFQPTAGFTKLRSFLLSFLEFLEVTIRQCSTTLPDHKTAQVLWEACNLFDMEMETSWISADADPDILGLLLELRIAELLILKHLRPSCSQ